MKKKKHLADLMEEDLLETIQQRINELNAELKLLNARHGPFFVHPGSGRLRCRLRRDLEREQERLRREQERRVHEARENLLECAKNRTLPGLNWKQDSTTGKIRPLSFVSLA